MTRKHSKIEKAPREPEGMKVKMFGYLALFTAIVLVVIWLFQAVLLGGIYRKAKEVQLRQATSRISAYTPGSESYEEQIYDIAAESNICVTVYEISGTTGKPIVSAHTVSLCIIHSSLLTERFLGQIYEGTAGGHMYTCISSTGISDNSDSMVCAKRIQSGNSSYLIVTNSEMQPVSATVITLRYQLIATTVILLVVSGIMAYCISAKFTKPVAAMNEEAKKLALGNYDVNFRGGEFRETAELGKTLNYAAKELSKLDTMQKELIANISHDLRTPLTMISGYSEVMRDIPNEMTPENIQIIIDETQRLTSLVNDMLDLSRLSGGKRDLKKTVFSLTDCVLQTVERFSHLKEKEGYTITFQQDGNVFVCADKVMILQVIYNLITNAINYSGKEKQVTISQSVSDGICRISVTDTGEGIPQEKLPFIWDRYYRASDFHKRGIIGTGLGLSIVKNALVMHGAQFGVSSKVGCGSTFWFELPCTDEHTAEKGSEE